MSGPAFERGPLLLIYALSRQTSQLMAQCFVDAPLTPEDFAVYSALRLMQPATPSALAATVGLNPPTLSNRLKRMQERRHLRRRVNPADRRSTLVSLTPTGLRLTEACFPHFQTAVLPLLDRLGADKSRILAAMEEMSQALDDVSAALDAAESGSRAAQS